MNAYKSKLWRPCYERLVFIRALASLLVVTLSCCAGSRASTSSGANSTGCSDESKWNDPTPPRRIFGNTWYVGTCAISAVLITSSDGHVLIDGATEQGAPLIEANIKTLGFSLKDVRYLLNTHEHFDHSGGLAQLQRDTGASVFAREPAATTLERGKSDRSDAQFLVLEPFPPLLQVLRIVDRQTVSLGSTAVTAYATPGHSPGSTSFTWQSCDAERCLNVAYADSVSAISDSVYKFSDEKQHLGVVATFQKSLETIASLPCDVLLTPHPSASAFWPKMDGRGELKLINNASCREYAATGLKNLNARLAQERAAATKKESLRQ